MVAVEFDPTDRQIAVLLLLVVDSPTEIDLAGQFNWKGQQDPHFVGNFVLDGCTENDKVVRDF